MNLECMSARIDVLEPVRRVTHICCELGLGRTYYVFRTAKGVPNRYKGRSSP